MEEAFSALHPLVAAWCDDHLRIATPPQREAIPLGLARRHHLICSPTGTGKTLAAFLPALSALAGRRDRDELYPRPYVLYLSPLRALGYDVEHNVRRPLREMGLLERPNSERAQLRRGRIRERYVRTGVRTSDTPHEERRLMLARPPHILMTTPESLALMLAMESYRRHLASVETVIVDEVHALAGNKRGSYLALCLESLECIAKTPPVRIGLSATVAPLEEVARFLVGTARECAIVDRRGLRAVRLGITAPFSGAMAPMSKIAQAAVDLGRDVRTQLVFTNVRSQAERLAHEMTALSAGTRDVDVMNEDAMPRPRSDSKIGIHHSALERSVRHRVEARLRSGSLQTVVCSSSLELGVDIGYIDRVCIHGGARGMTATLQRVGRAGHRPDAVADGVVIAQDRDDILEAAATRRCIHEGTIEEIQIPNAPLDVLAQWLVLSVCPQRRLSVVDALTLARRAAPYAELREDDLRQCALYLSGGGVGSDEAHVRRLGFEDETLFGLGREASSAFFENVGTIPDESGIVVSAGAAKIGKVEEDFVSGLRVGDVFLLSGTAYRVREIRAAGIAVEHAQARPNVPQWSSHIKGVPVVLAREIAALRFGIAERLRDGGPRAAFAWLAQRYALEGAEAAHAVRYIAQQMAVSLVAAPSEAFIELYLMDRSQTAVFHTCAGRRANETLARVVAARLLRETKCDSHLTTDDNGFLVTLPPKRRLPDAFWASLLHTRDFERDLLEGLRASHLLRRHFRYVANTGLLVLRRAGGRTLRRGKLRWNSERIFDRLFTADPTFPLVRETIRVVTRDLLDAPAALAYLQALATEPRVVHPPAASPFSFGIVTSSFGDSVVMDDRASMVEALHERVLAVLGETQSEELGLQLFRAKASV
ncbi:MAG TPA: DEAD/DEAH box helicase [Candidatus Acidoferrales bacterium]|nr:DEAD/DEAH box helicase [Candidatus Acidoferrales bacterium]